MGSTALHHAVRSNATDVMRLLVHSAPSTVNLADMFGCTSLFYAAAMGHGAAVALLLSVGASEKAVLAQTGRCALQGAIEAGRESVLDSGRAAFLRMLLGVQVGGGVDRGEYWAKKTLSRARVPPLHSVAAVGSLAMVQVLLAAGADEAAPSPDGKRARDRIGRRTRGDRDAAREAAIGRMLERGPAFRAGSWTWLAWVKSPAGGMSASPKADVPLGARIYRPGDKPVFSTRFARYVMK